MVLNLFSNVIGLMFVGTVAKQGMKMTESMFKMPFEKTKK